MTKKPDVKFKRVSLDLPEHMVNQIDSLCDDRLITRRKWFFDIANEELEKEKLKKIDMIVRK